MSNQAHILWIHRARTYHLRHDGKAHCGRELPWAMTRWLEATEAELLRQHPCKRRCSRCWPTQPV